MTQLDPALFCKYYLNYELLQVQLIGLILIRDKCSSQS